MADQDITLAQQLDAVRAEMEGIVARGELTDDDKTRFDTLDGDAKEIERRMADELVEIERAQAEVKAREERINQLKARMVTPSVTVGREDPVYNPERNSFFRDLWHAQRGDWSAAERLQRNNAQRIGTRAINTTNGTGGEFVPPLWLENEFIKLARPGRPFADAVHHETLPTGTDSINIPKIATGTAVALQGTQNSAVQQTDLTTSSISAAVKTAAGGQTVSLQMIEQSPLQVDRLVLSDLAADYARFIDGFTLNDATDGVLNTGTQVAVTGTATGAAAGAVIYAAVSKAIGTFFTTRYVPADLIVMHPRRWYWYTGLVDSQNRPFIVPNAVAFNPLATDVNNSGQGIVGKMLGLDVMLDASVPTNLGAGTNQDAILVCRRDDLWLLEGSVRAEAFPQTYANQLSLFVRLYNYFAFSAKRYQSAPQVIGGTQLNVLT